jgi:isopropylmalate/homocitrate/citramalate synthase
MESVSGFPIEAHEPIIGANVFSHESGIHTHAMLIDPRMYEAVPAKLVGGEMQFIYGKHSGLSVIDSTLRKHEARLRKAGVTVDSDLSKQVLEEVKRVREERARTGHVADIVTQYYENMRRLGLTEDDVIRIAEGLGTKKHATV